MITDEELEKALRSLRSHHTAALPLDEVLNRGRHHMRRRCRMQTGLALCALTAVVATTLIGFPDRGSKVITTGPAGGRTIQEVSASRKFEGNGPTNLAVGPDGALWAAWVGQGIYRFDDQMRVTRSIENLERGVITQAGGGIAVTQDGLIVAAGTSPSGRRDGHGDAVPAPTLRSVAADGTVSIIAVLSGEGPPTRPPLVTDGRVIVALNDRLLSVRLADGGIEVSATLDGGVVDFALVDDTIWATTGTSIYHLSTVGLVERQVERRSVFGVALADGGVWGLEEHGRARRLDGVSVTARGAWGDLLNLEPGEGILWATGQYALAAFDSETGDVIAWRPLNLGHGDLAASGTTVWSLDGLAGVIRRYELNGLNEPPVLDSPAQDVPNCPHRPSGSSSAVFDPTTGIYAVQSLAVVGERQLRFDVVQWLSGEDADEAYFRDSGDESGAPNDYYILNDSKQLRTALVTDDTKILVLRADGFAGSLHTVALDSIPTGNPTRTFWLTFSDGVIREICQQYRP